MIFEQRQLFLGSTHLALREQSLYVCKRNPQGTMMLETEVAYEDVLPVAATGRRHVPVAPLAFTAALLVWLGLDPWRALLATGHAGSTFYFWLGLTAVNVLVAWLRFDQQWSTFHLKAAHLAVVVGGRPWQRRQFEAFAAQLEARAKTYLRREYGTVNPLGVIEPQLRRVAWLRELDVFSSAEARALTTRLTGQVPSATLTGLGQDLDTPYVN